MELTTGPWSCEICGKVLSRKQRLITHKLNVHQIEPTYTVKQYKQYLKDPNIPVPDRTWYRHKKRKIDRNGEESAQTGSENIPSNSNVSFSATCTNVFCDSLDENSTVSSAESEPIINCNSIHAGDSEILHHGIDANCHIGAEVDSMYNATDNNGDQDKENDLFYGEDIEFEDDEDCDSNTSIDENSFIDSDNNTDDSEECNNVLQKGSREFTFQDEKCMALLSFILRYNLSGQAAQSLMKLLQLFGNFDKISFTQLKQIVGTCTANIVHFCDMCYTLFPEDEEVFHCPQEGCIGLRYKGNLNRQYLKQRKSFFACLPIVQQIKDILEREGMWQTLNEYKNNCLKSADIKDIINGKIYTDMSNPGHFLHSKNNISLLFNTDGATLYKSSGVSIWPVYLVINELPPKIRFSRRNMILWGVWQGRGKPAFQTFFQPFIKHMEQLESDGITITIDGKQIITKAILLAGTMDLVAKAYVTEMTQHNGKYGCITCADPGEVVKKGKGYTRVYPFREDDQKYRLRTSAEILQCGLVATESGKPEYGIKGVSSLHGLEHFDIVGGIVPDYMHGVLLGVTKQLLNLLLSSTNSKEPYFIGNRVKQIDRRLKRMKPTDHISRLPRKLENNLSHLKASELQVWLLFYALPCLQDFMSDCYLNHLALFIEGIYVLLQDTITEQQLQHAKNVLNSFYQDFGILYGSNNYTLNMHNVCQHLVDYVRNLGPLWAWSCFPFEDMNGILLDSVHGTGDACLQVLWAMQAQKRLAIDTSLILDADLRAYVEENTKVNRDVKITKKVANCSVAGGLALQQYMDQSLTEKLKILLKVETIGKISKVQRVIVNNDIFFSKEYKRMEKRIGNVVLTDQDSGMAMAAIQYFIYHHETNTCVAVVKKVSIKEDLPLVNLNVNYLIRVENFENDNELFVIPVDKIVEKVLYLSGNPKMLCIARLPNLYGQCC